MASKSHEDRRETLRIEADAPVTLRPQGRDSVDAQLIDISAGGAMVSLQAELRRAEEVLFCSRGVEVDCTVAWVADGQCGLAFHRRLHLGEVALLTRKGRRSLVTNG